MAINAELYSFPDEASQRCMVMNWLREHDIEFDKHMSTEDLIQLYRDVECGKYL